MEGESSCKMVILTSLNYSIWKPKVQGLLNIKDLFLLIIGKSKSKKMTDDEWEILHLQAVATVRQGVDVNIFHHIFEEVKTNK